MKRISLLLLAILAISACSSRESMEPVDFSSVLIEDSFWAPRLDLHKSATIPICIDQIEKETGRMRNFEKAGAGEGEHEGFFFDDSDVYKALEGLAYSLIQHPDPELEAKCDEWIAKIAGAQQEDGYINTFFTLPCPIERWTDMDKHELYCTGHMLEAAIAYYHATGKRTFLDVAQRMVDHAMTVIGPGLRHWVPGHEEIELALVKLYRETGEKKYLEFADWLLSQRGHGYGVYGDPLEEVDDGTRLYYQDNVPVREITDIVGHAVRAMYLYCGMADVASFTGDKGYTDALDRVWDDVVLRNMYITGGIGSSYANEGVTEDYDLPNLEAYCETCASIGMVLWNARMNRMKADARYADVMERSLYNAALAGVSLSGDRFFYVNPLESRGNHHRRAWFGCACCPSNICRFLPSIGGYIYGVKGNAVYTNLYIGSSASFEVAGKKLSLKQETVYPWDGTVVMTVGSNSRAALLLRIPAWCESWTLEVNGKPVQAPVENGYALAGRGWKEGDRIVLTMDMPVRLEAADPNVKADVGKRTVCRGPLVYCIEETDNAGFDSITVARGTRFETAWQPELLGGVNTITSSEGAVFVPYYAWDNREAGRMKVWIDYE
ncbi:MAG: glycoside hydrolase family 127 protein [Bacteroidales bacterium]|nr:glycoside hydrolase family 127 protein [Bacteroidales bacterium]